MTPHDIDMLLLTLLHGIANLTDGQRVFLPILILIAVPGGAALAGIAIAYTVDRFFSLMVKISK